ncbi:hypothetical protein QBC34DRAFT_471748 [Podospora aff. communis PSN243]|uniref:Uncharacterized protein n=1 Tax=Podospora aff. communis PSN243 TaxID=3040156 RepID=A0AAV9GBI6_9PEZI|nr:hypothetical protein QBC34DRAFT_471748 [Podospora aff. communis PSN243]
MALRAMEFLYHPARQQAWDAHWLSLFRCFDAALGTKAVVPKDSLQSVLALQGLMVDQICQVAPAHGTDVNKICTIVAQWQHMTDLLAEANDGIYPRGGIYEDAFWRLVTVDVIDQNDADYSADTLRRASAEDEEFCRLEWNPETRTGVSNVNSCGRHILHDSLGIDRASEPGT